MTLRRITTIAVVIVVTTIIHGENLSNTGMKSGTTVGALEGNVDGKGV